MDMTIKCNCYNCKRRRVVKYNPYKKSNYWCKKQNAWIHKPLKECPIFEISFCSRLFGDQTPFIRTEKLVGGCEED